MGLNLLIGFLKIVKIISPILTVAYMFTWITGISDEYTFEALDFLFGAFPNAIDKIIPFSFHIGINEVTLGYVFASIIMIGVCIFSFKTSHILERYRGLTNGEDIDLGSYFNVSDKPKAPIEDDDIGIIVQKEEKYSATIEKINKYFILFEFELISLDKENQNVESLQKIKTGFNNMVINEIKEKYQPSDFIVGDKIIITYRDLSVSVQLMSDIIKVYETISNASQKMSIKVNYLMSCYAADSEIDSNEAISTLSMINSLKFINQIIVSDNFYLKFTSKNPSCEIFESLGTTKLKNADSNSGSINMALFKLDMKKIEF